MPLILCIDDYVQSLGIRKLMLEVQGYSVLTAESGRKGLHLLEQNPVDAVVLDYRMPEMDGLEVARVIRERNPGLPIILLTGYVRELPEELVDMVNSCVVKGHDADALLGELQRLTGGAKKPPAAEIAARTISFLRNERT